jgi:hypothetical protein
MAPTIIRYFDETMGLYGIIGNNTISIDVTNTDGSLIFGINLRTVSDADTLESTLEQCSSPISIYGRSFSISYTRHNDLEIHITVSPVSASPL